MVYKAALLASKHHQATVAATAIMKVTLVFVLLAGLAACVFASGRGYGYDSYNRDGFRRGYNGIQAAYRNDERQRAVNRRAEYVGASSGTYRYDDVPGTNRDFGYGYGYGYNRGYGGNYFGGYY